MSRASGRGGQGCVQAEAQSSQHEEGRTSKQVSSQVQSPAHIPGPGVLSILSNTQQFFCSLHLIPQQNGQGAPSHPNRHSANALQGGGT